MPEAWDLLQTYLMCSLTFLCKEIKNLVNHVMKILALWTQFWSKTTKTQLNLEETLVFIMKNTLMRQQAVNCLKPFVCCLTDWRIIFSVFRSQASLNIGYSTQFPYTVKRHQKSCQQDFYKLCTVSLWHIFKIDTSLAYLTI